MDPDLTALAEAVEAAGADGYLLHDASSNSNVRYLAGFDAPDPFVTLFTGEETVLLVSELEYGRARSESRASIVDRYSDYDYRDLVAEHGRREGVMRAIAAFLEEHDVDSVVVPGRFPFGTAEGLRDLGLSVDLETERVLRDIRAVKHPIEIEHIRRTQRVNQRAMAAAESMIAAASVADDGTLNLDGETLTSERVKEEIEVTLLRSGCALDDTIVAGGADGADPHNRGSGPLRAEEPIIVDIFPRDMESKYFGDLTRTFVAGTTTEEFRRRYEVTHEAHQAAIETVEPGVTGADVHDVVCDIFEEAGYATLRSDPSTETGFIHGTGHGVGLDVHEGPSLAPAGEELAPGHVVTIEPGLYDPAIGGVRIEDLIVVTEDGHESLTDYPISMEPQTRE